MYEEENNGVLIETVGTSVRDYRTEQCSYWWKGSNDANMAFNAARTLEYESDLIWQIDVNITSLRGVTVQILNGTNIFTAGSAIEINDNDWANGAQRFTFNVTFEVNSAEYDDFGITDAIRDATPDDMKDSDAVNVTNNIWVNFTPVPGVVS